MEEENSKCKVQNAKLEISLNPFTSRLTIKFDLPTASNIKLSIYDIAGREVANLIDGFSASHSVVWEANEALPGIYFVRLETKHSVISKKVTLFRN